MSNSKMLKAEQYSWAKPGDGGKYTKLPIDSILVDHSYQRKEVSEVNTHFIARNFNWQSFGAIIVMQRDDGRVFVVDGLQRILAAKRREDIQQVPVMLFKSDGPEHEAKAFLAINTRRKNVRAVDKFRAAVMSECEPETSIAAFLATLGMHVSEDGKDRKTVTFPSALLRSWRWNANAAKRAIAAQVRIVGDEPIVSDIHKGLWYLIHSGVDIETHIDKLVREGGKPALVRSIRATAIEMGQKESDKVCAIGVHRMINHRRKHKVEFRPLT